MTRSLLISIRPKYVQKILDGTKTVELRKTKPNLSNGSKIFVYASSPVKALAATADLVETISLPPGELWEKVGHQAGVSKDEFFQYFAGCTTAHALVLSDVSRVARSVDLAELRSEGLAPPQSWRYLAAPLSL
ncbi:ASCH domain-containing protein [Corynebacterium glucuronolyticum]|uniref:ASCH domain-containing protein n=1 Tax=Corynebacterium glucuronolyticum TaxID=39791 RepID=UPI003F6E2E2B